jgi:nucleoside 2-deoxyribosyltransferase
MLAYLCGPIDAPDESGKLWRRKLAPFLQDQLGHRVCDPTEDTAKSLTAEEAANFRRWQTTDLDRFRRVARKMIAFNVDLIEHRADYVICCLEPDSEFDGATPAELTAAFRKGIPVYLVAQLPIEAVDAWVVGCSDQVFSTIEDLKDFLASRFAREKQTQLWKD